MVTVVYDGFLKCYPQMGLSIINQPFLVPPAVWKHPNDFIVSNLAPTPWFPTAPPPAPKRLVGTINGTPSGSPVARQIARPEGDSMGLPTKNAAEVS